LFRPAIAQNENWDTYMTKMGKMPASVLVDMGQKEFAPDPKFPNLVVTGPRTKNCSTMGLPDKDEIGTLEDILDATSNFLTGVTAKALVGTVTHNCERLNYYYVKDTMGIRNALNRMYSRTYKDYAYVISIRPDPQWTTYRNFLYPDEETRNWMDNDKIITKMLQQGDSLATPRNIRFEVYFKSDTERAVFVGFAKAKGYYTDEQLAKQTPNAPYEAIVSTFNKVTMDVISPMSFELKKEARKHNGFYNGWVAGKK